MCHHSEQKSSARQNVHTLSLLVHRSGQSVSKITYERLHTSKHFLLHRWNIIWYKSISIIRLLGSRSRSPNQIYKKKRFPPSSDNFLFQNNGKKSAHVGKQWFFWKTMFFKQCFLTRLHTWFIFKEYAFYQNKNYSCLT